MPTILPPTGPYHPDYITHFRARVLQDALAEATASYWQRRADAFEWAKPKPGEYDGTCDQAALSAAWNRCDEMAQACRRHADLLLAHPPITQPQLEALIQECA